MADDATTDASMGDSQTAATPRPQTAPAQDSAPQDPAPEAAPQPEGPAEPSSTIDDLMAEYEAAVPSAKPSKPASQAAKASGASQDEGSTDPRIGALIDVVRAQQLERLQAREDADARKVMSDAKQAIAEFAGKVPEDFAERWLMSEYQLNPRLSTAWSQRHESQAALARAERAVERALKDLHRAVQNVPEAKATADQEAVTAALRGASGSQPSGAAPDYGRMTDGEFRKSVEDEHGYTPGV